MPTVSPTMEDIPLEGRQGKSNRDEIVKIDIFEQISKSKGNNGGTKSNIEPIPEIIQEE